MGSIRAPRTVAAKAAKAKIPKRTKLPDRGKGRSRRIAWKKSSSRRIASGYKDSGLTRVPSPRNGNQRKLVTGRVTRAAAQRIFTIGFIGMRPEDIHPNTMGTTHSAYAAGRFAEG